MPTRSEITYFGAGPALLPTPVLETAAQALLDYEHTGLGIAEHSHRSEHAARIIAAAKADLAAYLGFAPADYDVLFLQAGGTGEFAASVYNTVGAWVARERAAVHAALGLAGADEGEGDAEEVVRRLRERIAGGALKLDYIVTGGWSLKAYQEAVRLLGPEHVNMAADARPLNGAKFGKIPDQREWKLSKDAAMVYYCDNETVDGVEFPAFPQVLAPKEGAQPIVVADMSSNILSRRVPVDHHSIIFFGAQKNLGCTGVTVAVVKRTLLPPHLKQPSPALLRKLGLPVPPIVFSYETIAQNNSLYNTLSIFDVFVAGQVLKRLLATYPDKVDGQQAVSDKKAKLIYATLDAHPGIYKVVPDKSVRSRMNVCFRVIKNGNSEEAEKAFLEQATARGLTGLKGHRSVSGIRASLYNSIMLEEAQKLANFIEEFARI
ncbi:hypothetical protein P8C59_006101 [Phyllachora maydis]|uniref:phosphoserine transaminase n=1 Tax=Phyllachora maydis TaxID=1825666 RepID=A0AAD9I629_9PEZI|nr:hypothetical protein P8C59_006101 [Phyllachora maydis]